MGLNDNRAGLLRSGARGARLVIVTAAIVFALLAIAHVLAPLYALAGFAVVAASALMTLRDGGNDNRLAQPVAVAARAGDPLRAVVAGLPDPVIALDRDGRVLALNERSE